MSIISSEIAQTLGQILELNKTAPYGYEYYYNSNTQGIDYRMKYGFSPQIIQQHKNSQQNTNPTNSTVLGVDFSKTSNVFGALGLLVLSIMIIKR